MKNINIIVISLLVIGIALVLSSVFWQTPDIAMQKRTEPLEKSERFIAPLPKRPGTPEILLGCSMSLTGRYHNEGQRAVEGYSLVIDRINADGGVKVGTQRFPMRVIYYDDASLVEKVRENVERLITEDRVDFMLGPFSSGLTLAASEVVEKHGVIMVEAFGASEVIFSRGAQCTFGVMTTASWYLRDFFKMISLMVGPGQTYAVIAMDKLFTRSVAKGASIWGKKFGFKEVYYKVIDLERDNWLIHIEELKAKLPDIVVFAGHYLDSVNFAMQLSSITEYHPKAVVLTLGPTQQKFVQELGEKVEYMSGISQWSSQAGYTGPFIGSSGDYARMYEKQYGVSPTYQNAQGSIACLIYKMALEKCDTLDARQVFENIRNLDTDTFYGKVRFDERGINIGHEMVVVQIQNGERKLVWSDGPTENAFVYPIPAKENR